jgi:hypothetical protein
MILTIIEPDWDLDNDGAESYHLAAVEWDSDAMTTDLDAETEFDPEPSKFRETGDSTGIFQVVIEIPSSLDSTNLERGEQIDLEYTDWGPSGANYVGEEDEDINVTVYTSNFGATVELDQKVYTWTDKVYITIAAQYFIFSICKHFHLSPPSLYCLLFDSELLYGAKFVSKKGPNHSVSHLVTAISETFTLFPVN